MPRYIIPVQERWSVIREWRVTVDAANTEEAIFQVDEQLSNDCPIDALEGVVSVSDCVEDWEEENPFEIQEEAITVGPCPPDPPDPASTTLL